MVSGQTAQLPLTEFLRGVIVRGSPLENGAKSLFVKTQCESVLLRKLSDLLFSIYVAYWPEALQVGLVNSTMPMLGSFGFQLMPNPFRKRFHTCKCLGGTSSTVSFVRNRNSRQYLI